MVRPIATKCTICADTRADRLGTWRCRCGNVRLVSGFYVARAGSATVQPCFQHHADKMRAAINGGNCRTGGIWQA